MNAVIYLGDYTVNFRNVPKTLYIPVVDYSFELKREVNLITKSTYGPILNNVLNIEVDCDTSTVTTLDILDWKNLTTDATPLSFIDTPEFIVTGKKNLKDFYSAIVFMGIPKDVTINDNLASISLDLTEITFVGKNLWRKVTFSSGVDSIVYPECNGLVDGEINGSITPHIKDLPLDYRIPTREDYEELINLCNFTLIDNYKNSGVSGILATLKADQSVLLFFPLTGWIFDRQLVVDDLYPVIFLWLDTIDSSNSASYMYLEDLYADLCASSPYFGFPIRLVKTTPNSPLNSHQDNESSQGLILSATYSVSSAGPIRLYFYNTDELGGASFIGGVDMFNKIEIDDVEVNVSDIDSDVGMYNLEVGTHTINFTLKEDITSVPSGTFYDCTSLTNITIPNGVTSIGEGAFAQCNNLTSVSIPNSVSSIGVSAFAGCYSLTSVIIPSGVTSIEYSTFGFCESLETITFADNSQLATIKNYAFNCSYLSQSNLVNIPDQVTIESYAFECDSNPK